jgi:hypothetical protein
MAGKRIRELDTSTTAIDTDYVAIDNSTLTDAKKITKANFLKEDREDIALRELASNKTTVLSPSNDVLFPTVKAVNNGLDLKLSKTTNIIALNDAGIADGEIAVFNLTNKDIRSSNKTISDVETPQNNWNIEQDNIILGNLSDTIRQSAMISRTGTGIKNGVALSNPISYKDSGARYEMLGQTLTNFITGGNFPNTTGWAGVSATVSAASNILSVTGNGTSATTRGYQTTARNSIIGHFYRTTGQVRVTNAVCLNIFWGLYRSIPGGTAIIQGTQATPAINQWYPFSLVSTVAVSTDVIIAQFVAQYADAATANGKVMQVKEVSAIDLSVDFGETHEPTAAQMDLIVPAWFDGTVNVVNPVVKTVGKNLFDGTMEIGAVTDAGVDNNADLRYVRTNLLRVAGTLLAARVSSEFIIRDAFFFTSGQQFISKVSPATTSNIVNYVIPSNSFYVKIIVRNVAATNLTAGEKLSIEASFQAEPGSVATTYESYKSNVLSLAETLRSVLDADVVYRDRLYYSNGIWKIDRYVNPADGLKQAMATENAVVSGIPYVYRDGTSIIETSVIAPLVDSKIPYADVYNTYVPTLVWTTATPTITSSYFRYCLKAGRCRIKANIIMSDGKGATNLTITLPAPVRVGSGNTVVCTNLKINATWSNPVVQVIESTNLITFKAAFSLTNGQVAEIEYVSEYEVV